MGPGIIIKSCVESTKISSVYTCKKMLLFEMSLAVWYKSLDILTSAPIQLSFHMHTTWQKVLTPLPPPPPNTAHFKGRSYSGTEDTADRTDLWVEIMCVTSRYTASLDNTNGRHDIIICDTQWTNGIIINVVYCSFPTNFYSIHCAATDPAGEWVKRRQIYELCLMYDTKLKYNYNFPQLAAHAVD